jgi:hypothetical protein
MGQAGAGVLVGEDAEGPVNEAGADGVQAGAVHLVGHPGVDQGGAVPRVVTVRVGVRRAV